LGFFTVLLSLHNAKREQTIVPETPHVPEKSAAFRLKAQRGLPFKRFGTGAPDLVMLRYDFNNDRVFWKPGGETGISLSDILLVEAGKHVSSFQRVDAPSETCFSIICKDRQDVNLQAQDEMTRDIFWCDTYRFKLFRPSPHAQHKQNPLLCDVVMV